MARKSVKTGPTRRDVLCRAAAAATLSCIPVAAQEKPVKSHAETAPVARNASAASGPSETPWWLRDGRETSRVVEARAPKIVRGTVADAHALRDLLGLAIERLTDESVAVQGWKKILGGASSIVLKFNSVGANLLSTNDTL